MTDLENGAFKPGTYVKGDVERVANSPSAAADLAWKGFKRKVEESKAVEAPAQETVVEPDAPADKVEDAPEPEKRGPGRPRKPVVEDK